MSWLLQALVSLLVLPIFLLVLFAVAVAPWVLLHMAFGDFRSWWSKRK